MTDPFARTRSLIGQTSTGVSRYLQLATLFKRHIAAGQWAVGAQIPTVDELASDHGVARATVRQALGILEGEHLIERYRAKGTFVTHRPQEQLWCEVETDWPGLLRSREGAQIEMLAEESGKQPPPFAHETGKRASAYRHFRRRHSRDGAPFLLVDVYIEEKLCSRIPSAALATRSALSLLADIPNIEIADVHQILTIGAADVLTAESLGMALNSPVAYVHRSAMDAAGRLICVVDSIYRGDVVRLDMKLK